MKPLKSTDDLVVFAGADKDPVGDDFEFGIYAFAEEGQDSVWLPASATDENLVAQLKSMGIGQVFKIVSETPCGSIGTVVNAIEVSDDMPVYKIPSDAPFILKL